MTTPNAQSCATRIARDAWQYRFSNNMYLDDVTVIVVDVNPQNAVGSVRGSFSSSSCSLS